MKERNIKLSTFAVQRLRTLEREVNVNKTDFDVADIIEELRKEDEVIEKLSVKELQGLGELIASAIR